MKIKKLTLINFASIYVGMGLKKLEIDFTKCKNIITLLVGPNGSGKTSILSFLHPYAYPGNMDIRNGSDIILPNEDGYKEIIIEDNEDIYVIKIHYLNKTNLVIKCFMSKNNIEMNPNGNVTSFIELIKIHLGLEPDFLKLLRLGSNVTSFINMKYTDRKKFTSQLLSDVDTYTIFYKKINDDTRLMKSLIRTSGNKLSKLNILDPILEENHLKQLEQELNDLQNKRDRIIMRTGNIESEISKILLEEELKTRIHKTKEEIKTLEKVIHKYQKETPYTIEELNDHIDSLKDLIQKTEIELSSSKNDQQFKLDRLNRLYEDKDNKESSLKMMDSKNKEEDLLKLKSKLENQNRNHKEILSHYPDDNFKIAKDEAIFVISSLDKLAYKVMDIMALSPKDEIKMYIKYRDSDIESVMKKKISIIDNRMAVVNMTLENINTSNNYHNMTSIDFECKDESSCPYKTFYHNLVSNRETDQSKLQKELVHLESKRTFYENVLSIHDIVKYIHYVLVNLRRIVEDTKFHKVISQELIYVCMSKKTTEPIDVVCDELRKYISAIESKTEIDKNNETLSLINKELELIHQHSITYETFKNDINEIYNRINLLTDDIDMLYNKIERVSQELDTRQKELSEYKYHLDNVKSIDSFIVELNRIKLEYDSYIEMQSQRKTLYKTFKELERSLYDIDKSISKYKNDYDSMKHNLQEYKVIKKDLDDLSKSYDELEIIKESLSSSKGIPLLYIQLYMRSSKKFINELLDIVYNGNFRVETFIVNEKEFRIPYVKNGILVDDIMYASDGERAFVSLITSLALLKQSIKNYNILLLDEIDAALDSESRTRFLSILEHYIQTIDCEQLFMITHNNAFDNYDVDLIITGKTDSIDNLKRANVIFAKE